MVDKNLNDMKFNQLDVICFKGRIQLKSYLHGNPALKLALNDDLLIGIFTLCLSLRLLTFVYRGLQLSPLCQGILNLLMHKQNEKVFVIYSLTILNHPEL